MRQLLSDIRVVEFSDEPAGAYCGKVIADLGAEVVKIEPPSGGELRARPGAALHLNTNKRSVVIQPGDLAGRNDLEELLAAADLVIESPGRGDLAETGFEREKLRVSHPRLVIASVSGFGAQGPYADYRWSDLVAQTAAWFTLPLGRSSQRVPVKHPALVAMCTLGHTMACGALAGVRYARATGIGAHVDCAAYEALASGPARIGRFLGWEYRDRHPEMEVAAAMDATLLPTGIFPCADGYVSMMSTPQQLGEMLSVLDDEALNEAFRRPDAFVRPETKEILDAALYPWLLSHTREELTAAAQAAQWPFAHVNSLAEVLEVDHLHQRGFWSEIQGPSGPMLLAGPPYRHAEGGWRLHWPGPPVGGPAREGRAPAVRPGPRGSAKTAPKAASTPPLDGIRVLDLTTVWSGPYLTLLLADLGAEVIRVENPSVFPPTTKGYTPRPDANMKLGSLLSMYGPQAPGRPDRPYNRHAMNNSLARNKLSCTLDPRRPEERELFMRLVEKSDVFVENLKASTLHRLGIHESELMDRNPRMIVLRVPPAGLTGDWASYTGFGAQFDGLSGMVSICGHRDDELVETPASMYMDLATGPAGAFAVLAALNYRETTGRGQIIELAQLENIVAQLGDTLVASQLGEDPGRLGNRDPQQSPQGVYRCRGDSSWLALTVTDDEAWVGLTKVLGRPELADEPTLTHCAGRYEQHDRLDEAISHWAAEQEVLSAFHALQAAGVAAAPLFDDEQLSLDPNVVARGWIRPLTSTDVGAHLHLGHAFSGLPQRWDRGAPTLGEDNEYVYRKVIGVNDAGYRRLQEARVAVEDYLDLDREPV